MMRWYHRLRGGERAGKGGEGGRGGRCGEGVRIVARVVAYKGNLL